MSTKTFCDICLTPGKQAYKDNPGNPVLRFGLIKTFRKPLMTRGAGALDLCMECWTKYAKPRMRRRTKKTEPLRLVRDEVAS